MITLPKDGNRNEPYLRCIVADGGYQLYLYDWNNELMGLAYGRTMADAIVNLGVSLGGRLP